MVIKRMLGGKTAKPTHADGAEPSSNVAELEQLPTELVDNTEDLQAHVDALLKEDYVTLDTEFHRERTYYPDMCLLQLAGSDRALLIDVLAKDIDLKPLDTLFQAKKVVKVLHSMGQDMEIMLQEFDHLPQPLFDTQVAAKMLGYGEAASYAKLVEKLCGRTLDKSSRFTDWSKRPLEQAQMDYAISDVTYLREVYEKLTAELAEKKRTKWYEEEMKLLNAPAFYQVDPEKAWEKIKLKSHDPVYVNLVKEIAAWREMQAQQRDVPRGRVMREEAILELASAKPKSREDIAALRFVKNIRSEKDAAQLIAAIEQGLAAPAPKKKRKKEKPPFVNPAMMDLMKILLKHQSDEHDIAPSVIAKVDDLKVLVSEENPDIPALHGWRYELFGQHAEALKAGKLALGVKGRKITLIKRAGKKDDD